VLYKNRLTYLLTYLAQEQEFTDNSVVANEAYQYRVTALNDGGESTPSEHSDLNTAKPLRGLSLSTRHTLCRAA